MRLGVTRLGDFIAAPAPLDADAAPWALTQSAEAVIRDLIAQADAGYRRIGDAAVHESAEIEPGAALKGPVLIGPHCFIASTALLRGGCWLQERVIIGPACELKTSFIFAGSKLAHLNFVGDSVLGADVNIEAGAMVANYRNERPDKRIRIRFEGAEIDTGVDKFGAAIGDHSRIGANAVIAPGALLRPGTIVPRLSLIDQSL